MFGDVEDRCMLINTYLDDNNNRNYISYMLSYARIKSKLNGFKTLKNDKIGTIFRLFFY